MTDELASWLPLVVVLATPEIPVMKGHLFPSMSFFWIVATSMRFSIGSKASTLLRKGSWKKFHYPVPVKLGMPNTFSDCLPSTRNLIANEGKRPSEASVSILVSDMRRIAWS